MKVLIVDDEASLLDAYKQAFCPSALAAADDQLSALASSLFSPGADVPVAAQASGRSDLELITARQGADAVAFVQESLAQGRPFQVAFIDIRMPPGIDGKETARQIRALDPSIHIVIVSAYSDFNIADIAKVAGPADKLFYISKPFTSDEVSQMAEALSLRWRSDIDQIERLEKKIRELSESEARATHAATHDLLTGAPNRAVFLRETTKRIEAGAPFALAVLGLDRFKFINDTFGHGAGDELICQVYARLLETLPEGAILARLSGDEFGILLPMIDAKAAKTECRMLIATCSQPFSLFGSTVRIGASVGLVMSSDVAVPGAGEALRCADISLFAAKKRGRGRVFLFDAAFDLELRNRRAIETALRSAIENNELDLHYQPIVDVSTQCVAGFEALLRWKSPELGFVSPAIFIPIAEESGLIRDIGTWVIGRALSDCRDWPEQYVSINLSARQFNGVDMADVLRRHADEAQVPYSRIQIEVTETAFFEDGDQAKQCLGTLQDMGFRVALDDFGTGYSSLFSVMNLPLNVIKIDKCFIDGLGNEPQAAPILSAIIHLARGLNMQVVAEGVETDAQCDALRLLGCFQIQGYLFSKPQSRANTKTWLEQFSITTQSLDLAPRKAIAQ